MFNAELSSKVSTFFPQLKLIVTVFSFNLKIDQMVQNFQMFFFSIRSKDNLIYCLGLIADVSDVIQLPF